MTYRHHEPKWPGKLTAEDMYYRTAATEETMEEYFGDFSTERIRRAMKVLERQARWRNRMEFRWGE